MTDDPTHQLTQLKTVFSLASSASLFFSREGSFEVSGDSPRGGSLGVSIMLGLCSYIVREWVCWMG